jgi:hypothetical protein
MVFLLVKPSDYYNKKIADEAINACGKYSASVTLVAMVEKLLF